MSLKKITFSIDERIAQFIREFTLKNSKTISEFISEIIKEWINNKNKISNNEKFFKIIENNPLTGKI